MDWRKFAKMTPLHIALLYLLSGAVWISFSGRLLELLTVGYRLRMILQSANAWAFIGINTIFFYWLMNLVVRSLKQSEKDLHSSYAELEVTHEELVATQEELRQQFEEVQEREAYYCGIYEGISSGVLVHDRSGQLIHANGSAWRLLGQESSHLKYQVENRVLAWRELVQYLINEENIYKFIEIIVMNRTEQKSWLLVYSDLIINRQKNTEEIVTTFIDRTEEKKLEIAATILSEINQLVLRKVPLLQIEQTLCERLVEEFNFAYVWVGTKEEDGSVAFCAEAGVKGRDIVRVRWDDSVYAQGAIGKAIRFGVPQVDILDGSSSYLAWADFLAANGVRSLAAFPLIHEGEVFGAFVLSSRVADFFGARLIAAFEHFSLQLALAFAHALDQEHLERYRVLAEHAYDTILFIRSDGQILDANESALRLYGYTREELLNLNLRDISVHKDGENQGQQFECWHLHKNGHSIPVEVSSKALVLGGQQMILEIIRDISERVENRKELEENETRYREMFEHMSNAVEVYEVMGQGEEFVYKEFNSAAERLHHLSREEVIGKSALVVFPAAGEIGFIELFHRVWQSGKSEQKTFCFREGEQIKGWREVFVYKLPSGELVAMHKDITRRKLSEEKIWHQAHHDALTDLPNRSLFYDHLLRALARAELIQGKCAVLFLDIDRFKLINDTMGHNSGDTLLIQVAERLRQNLPEEDIIGRQGGDEFLILLPQLNQKEDAEAVARKILGIFNKPFQINSQEVFVTSSLGISLYPTDGEQLETLVKQADTAMYYAKEQGRNNYQFYTEKLIAQVQERLDVENSLRKGLERNEFLFHYQPLVNLESGKIVGVEALIRWQSPERGLVSPGVFIPIAEETGLIVSIGEWALRNACLQNAAWQKKGYPPQRMAVNISARQFRAPQFVETVAGILKETGLNPQWLELEITESIAMDQWEDSIKQLQRLKEFGMKIAIDDFGTGYSSLNRLRRLPIDTLKIDQSFVREIGKDRKGEAVIRTIIELAKDFQLKVIAEGVETTEQFEFLRNVKCDEMQGYLFSRPLPLEDVEVLMVTHRANDLGENSLFGEVSKIVERY